MTDFLAFDGEDEPEEEEEDEGGSEDEDDGPNYGKIEDEDFTARKESDLEGVRYMNNRGVEALLREAAMIALPGGGQCQGGVPPPMPPCFFKRRPGEKAGGSASPHGRRLGGGTPPRHSPQATRPLQVRYLGDIMSGVRPQARDHELPLVVDCELVMSENFGPLLWMFDIMSSGGRSCAAQPFVDRVRLLHGVVSR